MRYLYHESGEATTLHNSYALGDDGVLEFDADGRSVRPVEDDVAELLSAMHRHVSVGQPARHTPDPTTDETGAEDADGGEAETNRGFDADGFVDRTPMREVTSDIEAGEADDHLDAVAAAADRQGVQNALDARRSELEDKG